MTETASVGGPHLLFVEDDLPTRSAVAANLRGHGYRVDEAGSVAEGIRAFDGRRPDLAIVDLGLPDRDGTEIVRAIRRDASTPILILSARGGEADKVAALELGADDYVTKPFGLEELRARINALLRRAAGPAADPQGILALGPVRMDLARRAVTVADVPVNLTPHEYELLKVMLAQPGRVLTRGRLLRAVWGREYAEEGHYLHVYVGRLRRKLAAADPTGDARSLFVAEPGVGYRVRDP